MAKFSVCRIYKVTLWLNFSLNCRVGRMEKPESGIRNPEPEPETETEPELEPEPEPKK